MSQPGSKYVSEDEDHSHESPQSEKEPSTPV